MRVKDGDNYVLAASRGGAPNNPQWVSNLRSNADVEIRDETQVCDMRVREVDDAGERARLWEICVAAFPYLRRIPGTHVAANPGVRRRTRVDCARHDQS